MPEFASTLFETNKQDDLMVIEDVKSAVDKIGSGVGSSNEVSAAASETVNKGDASFFGDSTPSLNQTFGVNTIKNNPRDYSLLKVEPLSKDEVVKRMATAMPGGAQLANSLGDDFIAKAGQTIAEAEEGSKADSWYKTREGYCKPKKPGVSEFDLSKLGNGIADFFSGLSIDMPDLSLPDWSVGDGDWMNAPGGPNWKFGLPSMDFNLDFPTLSGALDGFFDMSFDLGTPDFIRDLYSSVPDQCGDPVYGLFSPRDFMDSKLVEKIKSLFDGDGIGVPTLTEIGEMIGWDKIRAIDPNIISMLLEKYSTATSAPGVSPEVESKNLLKVIKNIDPDFPYVQFGEQMCFNQVHFMNLSPDAKRALMLDSKYNPAVAIGNTYDEAMITSVAKIGQPWIIL